jgi:hypothetical protein
VAARRAGWRAPWPRLAAGFPEPPADAPSDRAIRAYGTALRLALRLDSAQADELSGATTIGSRRSATR